MTSSTPAHFVIWCRQHSTSMTPSSWCPHYGATDFYNVITSGGCDKLDDHAHYFRLMTRAFCAHDVICCSQHCVHARTLYRTAKSVIFRLSQFTLFRLFCYISCCCCYYSVSKSTDGSRRILAVVIIRADRRARSHIFLQPHRYLSRGLCYFRLITDSSILRV